MGLAGDDIEVAVACFRAELELEALEAGTVDELEDHYREAIAAHEAKGMSRAMAIRIAGAEVGDLRVVARECARVRSNFGPRPTQLVAWTAAALTLVWIAMHYRPVPFGSPFSFHAGEIFVAGCAAVAIALVFRSPQALALVLGFVIAGFANVGSYALSMLEHRWPIVFHDSLPVELAILALIATRGPRITRAALAMAAIGWMARFVFLGGYNSYASGPFDLKMTLLLPALLLAAILLIGARVRWAWVACLAIFVLIIPELVEQFRRTVDPDWGREFSWPRLLSFVSPLVAAVLAGGNTRSLRDALQPLRDRINGAPPTQAA